jgi:Mlc titration factor MtfA (ptsG expression regulator)
LFFTLIAAAALLFCAWLLALPWLAARRRARVLEHPFPPEWHRILRRRVPIAGRLPPDLRHQLRQRIQVFLNEKPFLGCAGLEITDEVRVTVAAQACLLLLGKPSSFGFSGLRQVLVYPGALETGQVRTHSNGVVEHVDDHRSGESWGQGQVVLSWDDVCAGASDPGDGYNVVLHEFAHQLDQETGVANGAPELATRAAYERWSSVLGREFEQLRGRVDRGEATLLDDYGATEPAEFFAVATECFFELPVRMADEHPELFRTLHTYYRIDPRGWVY